MNNYIQHLAPFLEGKLTDMTLSQRERIWQLPEWKFNAILLFARHQFSCDQPLSWKVLSRMSLICMIESGGQEIVKALNRMDDFIILKSKNSRERFLLRLKAETEKLKRLKVQQIPKSNHRRTTVLRTDYRHRPIIAVNGCIHVPAYRSS